MSNTDRGTWIGILSAFVAPTAWSAGGGTGAPPYAVPVTEASICGASLRRSPSSPARTIHLSRTAVEGAGQIISPRRLPTKHWPNLRSPHEATWDRVGGAVAEI